MIVDEPTAGLDPAERVRFLNLLSELGEVLLEAEPVRAVDDLQGRIWQRVISDEGIEPYPKLVDGVWRRVYFVS